MDVVIVGPSDRSILWRHGQLEEAAYKEFVNGVAGVLAKHVDRVIITLDIGVYRDVAERFHQHMGRAVIAYRPAEDAFGTEEQHDKRFEMRTMADWYQLNAELVLAGDLVLCLGFSPGSLIEIAYLKYHAKYRNEPRKLLIDSRCIPAQLPSLEELQPIYYDSDEELGRLCA